VYAQLLSDKGVLRRCWSQNIDSLESKVRSAPAYVLLGAACLSAACHGARAKAKISLTLSHLLPYVVRVVYVRWRWVVWVLGQGALGIARSSLRLCPVPTTAYSVWFVIYPSEP
jgi:hypothetical protein